MDNLYRRIIIWFFGRQTIIKASNGKITTFESALTAMSVFVAFGAFGYVFVGLMDFEYPYVAQFPFIIPFLWGCYVLVFYLKSERNRKYADYENDWAGRLFYLYKYLKANATNTLTYEQMEDFKNLKLRFAEKYKMPFMQPELTELNRFAGGFVFVAAVVGIGLAYAVYYIFFN